MFQTIRLRLALWYSLVTGVLLLCFALVFFLYVRQTLIDRVDDTITHVAEVLARSWEGSGAEIQLVFKTVPNLEADHIDLEWFDKEGNLEWSTFVQAPTIPLGESEHFVTIYPPKGEPLRQLTKSIVVNQQLLGYLRISHPWFEVSQPIRKLSLELCLGVLVTVIVVGICGWWLSGIAMQPIQDSYQQLKQFTADVSHELRNPLAVIQTNTQVALLQDNPKPYLEVIERLTKRMGKLLEDLLFLARNDWQAIRDKPIKCNLTAILQDVLEEQQLVAITRGVNLEVRGIETKVEITGYPDQLCQLLTNLLSNAIKFTPTGGKVEIALIPHNHQAQIIVKDSGKGITDTRYIFQRFYRGEQSEGWGLGLAIVQAIVECHRGKIKVDSKLGEGTKFIVTLPYHV
ncbi:MAG: HAMP domain-containing sensor histidine kinase [Pseudanabaenaceae cyanobacterium SKYGB_i_bin29]|nr:HAMP domain-containing histidine kinase [Pseudanabaenaceae cyanobacterium SKYG29]MDW8421973.1 HAMP domain-containing sensor histidine kinase [Pseudanabaenaceae cyanobacterium SKYGB_i_bin29]